MFILLASVTASGQEVNRPLDATASASTVDFQSFTALSPDGNWAAYTICDPRSQRRDAPATRAGAHEPMFEQPGCTVWVVNTRSGKSQQIMRGTGTSWGPAWSPDGRILAFYADIGRAPHLWIWERETGRARQAASAATRTTVYWEAPVWTPNGGQVVTRVRPVTTLAPTAARPTPSHRGPSADPVATGPTVSVLRSSAHVVDGDPSERAANDAEAPDTTLLADLALIDLRTERVRLLASRVRTSCYRLSPDGAHLAYTDFKAFRTIGDAKVPLYISVYDLVVVDMTTARSHVAVPHVQQGLGTAFSWSPDGTSLAYLDGTRIRFPDYRTGYTIRSALSVVPQAGGASRRFRVDSGDDRIFENAFAAPLWDAASEHVYLTDGQRVWRASLPTMQLGAVMPVGAVRADDIVQRTDGNRIWSPDSASVYVLTNDALTKHAGVYRVALADGRATRVLDENKMYKTYSWDETPVGSNDGQRIIFRAQSATEPADLWVLDASHLTTRQLTTINPQLHAYQFGASRLIDFRSGDGEPLRGTLLLPAGYVEGRRYPLVVWVYGGSFNSENLNKFGLDLYNLQLLSTRGYAVLSPDMPVQTGTPMQDLMKDVMPAVDRVVELGIADPDRLALMGVSNGGYSTLALVAQTSRFKAAVMCAGFGNLSAFYGTMMPDGHGAWIPWLETLQGAIGAAPWEAPERYVQNSPIFSLDRIHTPLLIEVGADDGEFVTLSNEVFVGLERLGRDATYLRYAGEGHILQRPANLVDFWTRVLAFLSSHLAIDSADHEPVRSATR